MTLTVTTYFQKNDDKLSTYFTEKRNPFGRKFLI